MTHEILVQATSNKEFQLPNKINFTVCFSGYILKNSDETPKSASLAIPEL
jgi:hypothetical protein